MVVLKLLAPTLRVLGENSVSSAQRAIRVQTRTHRVCRRTHRVFPKTQWVRFRNIRNQEWKGGFRKGGFCRIQCYAQEKQKLPKDIGSFSALGTQSTTAKRGIHSCKNPLQKKPFFWFLKTVLSKQYSDHVPRLSLRPPPTFPVSKNQKRVFGRVSGGVRGSWPTPENEPKTSLLETLRVKNHLFLTPETRFWLVLGARPGPSETLPETLPETLFCLFETGRVLTPLPGRGGRKIKPNLF